MALIKTPGEIEILQKGGEILGKILASVAAAVKPGISTADLERLATEEIKKAGAEPAFLGYRQAPGSPPYPASLCASVDYEVVHSLPSPKKILRAGQIIGLDLGIKFQGLYTDAAVTVPVGKVSREALRLIETTKTALAKAIAQVRPGSRIGDIAYAIQTTAESAGYSPVRDLVGHGVGHEIHEPPAIPNYGHRGTLQKLRPGMVLAIEPMFNLGSHHIRILEDGWTVVTADESLSAHFEHTVLVTKDGHLVLTKIS
jgi:methionyl aminopeptidase